MLYSAVFLQKYNRRKTAREHVRQKLQEQPGLTPQSVVSVQQDTDTDPTTEDGGMAKLKKCCVSFQLSSPRSVCSCRSASASSTAVCGMLEAVSDISDKNKALAATLTDVQNSDGPEPRSDLVTSKAELTEPDCHVLNINCGTLHHNSVNDENSAAATYSDARQQSDSYQHSIDASVPQQVLSTPKHVYEQCASHLPTPEKANSDVESSLIANSLNVSQKLHSSSVQNVLAPSAGSSGFELNFSSLDDSLLARFAENDCRPCEEGVLPTVALDRTATGSTNSVENSDSYSDCNDMASLCRAISAVKVAVVESVRSGLTDFSLPDSQYGAITRLRVMNKSSSHHTVDNNTVERTERDGSIGSSSLSSSQLSSSSFVSRSACQLQLQQWYAACI